MFIDGYTLVYMIIRNRTTKTLEASPLNNRGCAVPPDRDKKGNIDPEGVAHYAVRALFQSACLYRACYPGVLATLVPSVIERRPRCGLFGGMIADNQYNKFSKNNPMLFYRTRLIRQKSNGSVYEPACYVGIRLYASVAQERPPTPHLFGA